jgi:cobalt/nickel transport system ATP-binding protein
VLALDEPTAGLDPQAVRETLAALDRLHRDRTSLVLATHDVSLALAWADTVAVVIDGRVRHGDPVDVLDDAELVARARLERPWILAVADRLHRLGLLPTDVRPRTEHALVAVLDALGASRSWEAKFSPDGERRRTST